VLGKKGCHTETDITGTCYCYFHIICNCMLFLLYLSFNVSRVSKVTKVIYFRLETRD
jgi:hypothetical protein